MVLCIGRCTTVLTDQMLIAVGWGPPASSSPTCGNLTQDDNWDRPIPRDEDEDEDHETGYILAAIRNREPSRQSEDVYVLVLVDSCADC